MMDRTRHEDVHLLSAARGGDPEAFAEFYRRHEEAVLVFMLRRTDGVDVAVDLTAEVFAFALAGVGRYNARKGLPIAWLFGIAGNVLRSSRRRSRVSNEMRRRLGMPRLEVSNETVDHLERLADRGAGADALRRLALLPDGQREAIEQVVLGERRYDEVATDLECSVNVVRQRVSRGLHTLRVQMESQP